MLRKFSVTNYKNFKDTITFDLTNIRSYEFKTECIKMNTINKSMIFGINGCGKTNFGYALFDIVGMLADKSFSPFQKFPETFLNRDSDSKYAEFTYQFKFDKDIIDYDYKKSSPNKVIYEKLEINNNVIFEMNYKMKNRVKVNNLGLINADTLSLNGLDGSVPALRYIIYNSVQGENDPIKKMQSFVDRMLMFRSLQDGNEYVGYSKGADNINQYIINNGLIGDFQKFLKDMAKLDMKLEHGKDPNSHGTIMQKFKNGSLPLELVSSSGTKSLELAYYWIKRAADASLIYLDEYDAYYHYELAERVARMFIDDINAQVIFTSHNTNMIDTKIMRPDCYMVISNGTIRSFADSTERELREGHNLEKLFLSGEFHE